MLASIMLVGSQFHLRIGNAGLDGSVADHLELNIEGRVALGQVDRESAGHGDEQ